MTLESLDGAVRVVGKWYQPLKPLLWFPVLPRVA